MTRAKPYLRRPRKPPIGLWAKLAPEPEETVMGLLLRIAEAQGHGSMDRTLKAAGVWRGAISRGMQPDLDILAQAILQNPRELAADSPQRDARGRLTLRGHFVGEHVEFGRRRLCPSCVEAHPHHRFWWDVECITTCPRHGLNLVDACLCGTKFGWRDGSLLKCARRNDGVHGLRCGAADAKLLRKDAYLLGRLGAGAAEPVPILDPLSVDDVFDALERIGAAAEGYSREWRSAKSLGQPLGVLQARGFDIIVNDSLDEVLTRIYDGFIAQGGKAEEGFSSCYGWFYHWINDRGYSRLSPLLAQKLLDHGIARFPVSRALRLGRLDRKAVRRLSLKAAAEMAGTNVHAMKSIGVSLGLIRANKHSGRHLSFPVEEVERIARDLKGAMSLKETTALLGIGNKAMAAIMKDGSLVPALRGGHRVLHYVFRPQDVDEFLRKLAGNARKVSVSPAGLIPVAGRGRRAASTSETIREILKGRLRVQAVLKGESGLRALLVDPREMMEAVDGEMLSFSAAAIRMRLNSPGLRKAIELGLIDGARPGSSEVPAKVADDFADRFMTMSEIQGRVGGDFGNLRDKLRLAGFDQDPGLRQCRCAAYLRSVIEPFVRKVETGQVVLGKPEGTWKALIREAKRILAKAKAPVPGAELISKIRQKMTLGPSDDPVFLRTYLWESRESIVHIEGAGWWLRDRPYLGRTFALGGPKPTMTQIVDEVVLELLKSTSTPLARQDILARLKAQSIRTPTGDGELFLRRFFNRHVDKTIKLAGLGYWDRARPYPPALYNPVTWMERAQSVVQRAGLWIMKLIEEEGRPLTRAELEVMLLDRGVLPKGCCSRSYVADGIYEFRSQIIFLNPIGYWLARKPWPAAGYRPTAGRKVA
ncbi:hypothetical protein ABIF79_010017 [Bradyrhizobium japonicum]